MEIQMLWHRVQQTSKLTIQLAGLVLLCASVIVVALPTKSCAETAAPQTGQLTAYEQIQRGAQLRADIDAAYKKLRASKSLKDTVHDGNDVTAIVLKYIPLGISFDDAEAILEAAGCTVGPPIQGHISARTLMADRLLALKHAFAVDLAPRVPGDFSVVDNVRATIYLDYVPNADRH
ncbi:MAG: hypothetical protein ACLPX1_18005 [Steroidobacteraceae bacterium]